MHTDAAFSVQTTGHFASSPTKACLFLCRGAVVDQTHCLMLQAAILLTSVTSPRPNKQEHQKNFPEISRPQSGHSADKRTTSPLSGTGSGRNDRLWKVHIIQISQTSNQSCWSRKKTKKGTHFLVIFETTSRCLRTRLRPAYRSAGGTWS